MTGNLFLDWAALAVSLFDAVLQLWLGWMVLLNAERRTWGIWLAGGGLLLGGLFFLLHSAALGVGLASLGPGFQLWWLAGWLPVMLLPFAWYVLLLWYNGCFEPQGADLRRRQRPWLVITSLLGVFLLALAVLGMPAPLAGSLVGLDLVQTPSVAGIPLVVLLYPLFVVLCIVQALVTLRHPAPSGRLMGEIARQRARPWLIATSLIMLAAGLLGSGVMAWFARGLRDGEGLQTLLNGLEWFDLLLAVILGVGVWTVGQSIVSYEVFTGKSLPRQGLRRYWQQAVILAACYSLLVSVSLVLQWKRIYILLLATLLLTIIFALLSWRSYAESEQLKTSLRPFLSESGLFDRMLAGQGLAGSPTSNLAASQPDLYASFAALCAQVLEAESGALLALGVLAPLVSPPLIYPAGESRGLPDLATLDLSAVTPATICLPLEPQHGFGLVWAIPLWSERGLSGLFLLGAKRGGGLYSQEEIEIAQAAGERLIDLRATAELARRLLILQRQSMVQSQLGDQRTRRELHDEVLPRLHTAMLTLAGSSVRNADQKDANLTETVQLLAELHGQISDLLQAMPAATPNDLNRYGLVGALRRTVELDQLGAFAQTTWKIQPEAEAAVQQAPGFVTEVLYYAAREAIRNAGRYAQPAGGGGLVQLSVSLTWQDGLELRVEDNGMGFGFTGEAQEGSSPWAGGGAGQGLSLHSALMAVIGGSLSVDSLPGNFTRVLLRLPGELWPAFLTGPLPWESVADIQAHGDGLNG